VLVVGHRGLKQEAGESLGLVEQCHARGIKPLEIEFLQSGVTCRCGLAPYTEITRKLPSSSRAQTSTVIIVIPRASSDRQVFRLGTFCSRPFMAPPSTFSSGTGLVSTLEHSLPSRAAGDPADKGDLSRVGQLTGQEDPRPAAPGAPVVATIDPHAAPAALRAPDPLPGSKLSPELCHVVQPQHDGHAIPVLGPPHLLSWSASTRNS